MLFDAVRNFTADVQVDDDLVEWAYAVMVVGALANCTEENTYIRSRFFIGEIVNDEVVRSKLAYFSTGIQTVLVGQLIKHRFVGIIWAYFKLKRLVRSRFIVSKVFKENIC